ncbi:ATP synthase subunit O, mitochondrial [Euphorbia lathyris]|uniref:ATP synthase subunit O, mitochondrial n=1 Tax=Euphorbia lathyris TaxID=212925 RepID=UPI003313F9DB
MAVAGRLRSGLPLLNRILRSDSLSASRSSVQRSILCPTFTSETSKSFATASGQKEAKVKVPIALYGGTGKYASALYIAAKKANILDTVETELLDLVEATKKSPTFLVFMKDLSLRSAIRVKAIDDICAEAKFSEITRNFLVLLAENGRLRYVDSIAEKFVQLTMADRGEVKAIVTSVIPLPPEEEKDLKLTLQEIIGQGKTVKLEQKIDPSILGGLVVEFDLKVFDMSIKTRAKQMERFLREPINLGAL